MIPIRQYDVVIVGGGPAGCSAAAILAEKGNRVVVLEREKFPRYHIGESMIPFTYPALERIGMIPKLRKSAFVKKYSVQFVSPSGKASQPFYFFNRYDKDSVAQTWQVLRSEFDQMMMENARELGAEVIEEIEVTTLLEDDGVYGGVRARSRDGAEVEFHAPITIDATGREAIAATRNAWRRGDPKLNKVAVWTYYDGATRDEGIDEGATTIGFIPDKGWFWYIPQHNQRISVGVVADGKYLTRGGIRDPRQIFEREVPQNKWIADHLAAGKCTGEFWLTSEYTFRSKYSAADGLVLAGDAFGFLDPVFSSGLMIALKSGVAAADAAHEALVSGDFTARRFQDYSQMMIEGIENMRRLVYAFYDPNVSFKAVVDKYPDMNGALTDCLSGDVNRDYTLLHSILSEYTLMPERLPYGIPLAGAPAPAEALAA